jgi:flagellar basal-body rod protein FlgG
MSGTIYKAGAGAILQQMRLDIYANNLANIGTAGYKSDQPVFRLDNEQETPDTFGADQTQLSPYPPKFDCVTDYRPGPVQRTGNPLDVAIMGKGFFEIRTEEGIRYTRNGRFSINEQGVLSNAEGWPVLGQGGEISINGSRVEISENGEVAVDGDIVGVLRVMDFAEPYNLEKEGNSLFVPGDSSVMPYEAEDVRVAQGSVESSNVNAIRTMTEMIELLRAFQMYQKVISAADDATAKTVNDVGKTS